MKDPAVTSVAAVEVDNHLVGYIYLVSPTSDRLTCFWRYVESASGACYSHEDMVILLGLIKSSLRVARWHQIEVVAMLGSEGNQAARGKAPWEV